MPAEFPTRMHIGTQKAGSTYLYNLLATHPDAGLSELAEVNFFSEHYDRGVDWYQSVFPKEGMLIDCSPTYFKYGATAAERIRSVYGERSTELKFLLILRNPIDYVHSHFTMQRMQGYFAKRSDLYPVVPDTITVCARMYPNYLRRGRYAELLGEWFTHFAPEQFLIVPFEEFTRNETAVLKRIEEFWGLREQTLYAPSVSQNRALRHPFLSRLRDGVIARPGLKRFLKHNFFFQRVFSHLLTVDTKERLGSEGRRELGAFYARDVRELRKLGVDTSLWADFN